MRKSILLIIILSLFKSAHSQHECFRDYLNFDTIIFFKTNYEPQKYQNEFSLSIKNDKIFSTVSNAKTDFNFNITEYDIKYYSIIVSFSLKNTFKDEGHIDMDVKGNLFGILSYNGWHVYRLTEKDTVLVKCKRYHFSIKSIKNAYTKIEIVNDSIIALARAYKFPKLEKDEPVSVTYYDFKNDKELNRLNIFTELPELSYFMPNNRITFNGDKCYISDFNKFQIFEVTAKSNKPKTIISDTDVFAKVKLDNVKLKSARIRSITENNIGPILNYLQPYMDSIFVLSDINVLNDSTILTRYSTPPNDTTFKKNKNFIGVCLKKSNTDSFKLIKSFYDEFIPQKDSIYVKKSFYTSTLTNKYEVLGNKIFFLIWTTDIYPIGMNKKKYKTLEKEFLLEKPSIPAIVVYEIKDSFFYK
ncbi:MAG: hypothetical protein WCO54_03470 [Bacteroidota bacterium]